MSITYLKGDATKPITSTKDAKLIVHCVNDLPAWGSGFVLALSKLWKNPELCYRNWGTSGYWNYRNLKDLAPRAYEFLPPSLKEASIPFYLGQIQVIPVGKRTDGVIYVVNLVGQRDVKPYKHIPPVRYEAFREGFLRVKDVADELHASIHMPRIGCGLAGGNWEMVEKCLPEGLDYYVYDLP
jgi:O-acetyl-ADP-ribose deacetylase (regulator of RNase III)